MKRSGCKVSKSTSALRQSCEKVFFESLEQRLCFSGSGMTLTPAGVSAGFTLTPFATNFPVLIAAGPLGMAFPSTGTVLVSDASGNVRVFPSHANGQSATAVPVASALGNNHAIGMAQLGSNIYMTDQASAKVVQLNSDGIVNRTVATGIPLATGIVANAFTGHLFVSEPTSNAVVDVDPSTGTVTKFLTDVPYPDGLTLSGDGKTLYVALAGTEHVVGYNTTTKAVVFDSGALDDVDGAALGGGTLAGNLFVNTNDGELIEINLATNAKTTLATGGSRGDFVSVDPTDFTLLITQSDKILRLGPGPFIPAAAPPSIGSLSASPGSVTAGNAVTLTATGVTSTHGSVTGVSFYRESNNIPGLQTGTGGDTLISTDSTSADGYTAAAPTTGLNAGNYTYYAQAVDSSNTLSNVVSAGNTVVAPPALGSLLVNPSPVTIGNTLTFTASGANPSATSVSFYMESNNTPGLQTGAGGDTLVGTDANGADGFSTSMATTGMHAGSCTFYARAADSHGTVSNVVSASDMLNNAGPNASSFSVSTTLDTPIDIDLLSKITAASGASLVASSLTVVASPTNGMTVVNTTTGHITYWPAEDFTGTDSFQYTIKDSTGTVSNVGTVTIGVTPGAPGSPVLVFDDPCNCCGGGSTFGKALVVVGSDYDDTIKVQNLKGQLDVLIQTRIGSTIKKTDTLMSGSFSHIIVYGKGGNDTIQNYKVATPSWFFGGTGNDKLQIQSGSGRDAISAASLLVGGDGNDTLEGSNGNDVMIGGKGKDSLDAEAGDDLVIGGYTNSDKNLSALCQIMSTWTSKASYASRTSQLSSMLNGSTVHADGTSNRLDGDAGNDWFFGNVTGVGNNGLKDTLAGNARGETITNIVL